MNLNYNDDTLMPFGRYQGKPLIDVPARYLLWLYEKGLNQKTQQDLKLYIEDNLDVLRKEARENQG